MQYLALRYLRARIVFIACRTRARYHRHVDDVGTSIQFNLRHRVAGRVVPALAHIEQVVSISVADIEAAFLGHRCFVTRKRIIYQHIGDRRVPKIRHHHRVTNHLPQHVCRAARRTGILFDVQYLHNRPIAKIIDPRLSLGSVKIALVASRKNITTIAISLHPALLIFLRYLVSTRTNIRKYIHTIGIGCRREIYRAIIIFIELNGPTCETRLCCVPNAPKVPDLITV